MLLLLILKVVLSLIFWGIFIWVIFSVPYPESLTQADFYQLGMFFIPLFLALVLTLNLGIRKIATSLIISTALVTLLIMKALDSLNIYSFILTVLAVILLLSYFGFGNLSKIPYLLNIKKFRRKRFFDR